MKIVFSDHCASLARIERSSQCDSRKGSCRQTRKSILRPRESAGQFASIAAEVAAGPPIGRSVLPLTCGAHAPALTIIITGIYAEEWLLEIEAIAAAQASLSRLRMSEVVTSITSGKVAM